MTSTNSTSEELAIDVKGLTKSFGTKKVVSNLSLQVKKGEIFGFLGPNGSGKTTSIRMMCGLLTPDSGSGTCLGFDILKNAEEIKRNVGYMTQKFSYWEDLTIRENLDFIARIYGMKNRKQAVDHALENLGLASRASQLAGSLSGGWKQRVALAACMLHEPSLLLLDEPTAGVDPKARRDFWEEIHLLAAKGISVLVSTHYMDEAERCHKLAYIAYSNLLIQGTASEVIESQNLTTWAITGNQLASLNIKLKDMPGIEQSILFGNTLHVTGKDPYLLEQSIKQASIENPTIHIEKVYTSLEDVFIHLMERSADNFKLNHE